MNMEKPEKPKTTSDTKFENLLVFQLAKNREPGAKKGKPQTARDKKPKNRSVQKPKNWLQKKMAKTIVRRNFLMSESGNVKVNQPNFLVKVGNMLDMVGILAVIL